MGRASYVPRESASRRSTSRSVRVDLSHSAVHGGAYAELQADRGRRERPRRVAGPGIAGTTAEPAAKPAAKGKAAPELVAIRVDRARGKGRVA